MLDSMTDEIGAIKKEIHEAIVRRLNDDERSSEVKFGLAATAVAEVLADLIFAAASDERHGLRLLQISLVVIESRWKRLSDLTMDESSGCLSELP
jgi:hypothetical protein